MSLVNQPIFRKGVYVKALSNKVTYSGATINAVIPMGAGIASSQFATYATDRITITETSKYKITYTFLSSGLVDFTFNSYANFSLFAGSSIIGTLSGFFTGGIETNDFGLSSYYTLSNDTLNASTFFAGNPNMNWIGFFNKSVEVTLNSGDEIYFKLAATNVELNHRVGFDGYLIIEQIS